MVRLWPSQNHPTSICRGALLWRICVTTSLSFLAAQSSISAAEGKLLEQLSIDAFAYSEIVWVSFSPDGKRLVSNDRDGKLHIWDATNGKPIATREPPGTRRTDSFACFQNGRIVATFDKYEEKVSIWEPDTGKTRIELPTGYEPVNHLAFSADGRRLMVTKDSSLQVWNIAGEKPTRALAVEFTHPRSRESMAALHPHGKYVAGASIYELSLWKLETGKLEWSISGARPAAKRPIAWSADGTRLATAGHLRKLKIWKFQVDGAE